MSRVISPVTGKPYGIAAVCRVWRLARSGVYRHLSAPVPPPARQPWRRSQRRARNWSDRLKAKLGAALIERDLLHEQIAVLEANRPLSRRTFRP